MYLFIINPRSGGGAGGRTWHTVEALMKERSLPFMSLFTHSVEGAEALVLNTLKHREDWKAVIVIGGDGTLHSILGALCGKDIPMGVIPAAPATTPPGGSASRFR